MYHALILSGLPAPRQGRKGRRALPGIVGAWPETRLPIRVNLRFQPMIVGKPEPIGRTLRNLARGQGSQEVREPLPKTTSPRIRHPHKVRLVRMSNAARPREPLHPWPDEVNIGRTRSRSLLLEWTPEPRSITVPGVGVKCSGCGESW